MAYLFQSDIYCDDCGKDIQKYRKEALMRGDGGETSLSEDEFDVVYSSEYNYDSDEFPKYVDNDSIGASDSPQHCGSHESCLNAEVLPSGRKVGALLNKDLTEEGVRYVRESVAGGGEVAEFWEQEFGSLYDVSDPEDDE